MEFVKEIVKICKEENIYTANFKLLELKDPQKIIDTYMAVARHFYWEEKNLDKSIFFNLCAINYGESFIHQASSLEQAKNGKIAVSGFYYDIGSFSWKGWGEKDIKIDSYHSFLGYNAAKAYLKASIDLGKEKHQLGRAYWLIGAHEMDRGDFKAAYESFKLANVNNEDGPYKIDHAYYFTYMCFVKLLLDPNDKKSKEAYEKCKSNYAADPKTKEILAELKIIEKIYDQKVK